MTKQEKLIEMIKENLIQFAKYYHNLTPPERCTVHPPNGEGMKGLYEQNIEDILDTWLRKYNVVKNFNDIKD